MGKNRKRNNRHTSKKMSKKKITVLIVIAALIVAFAVGAILWISRPKYNGIYDWYGGKMKADYILKLTIDVGEEKEYLVPFSVYRAVFLYYGERITDYISYNTTDDDDNDVTVSKYVTVAEQSAAVKEATDVAIVEYYDLVAFAEYLGVGFENDEDELFETYYKKLVQDYAATVENTDSDMSSEEYAEQQYENSIAKLGMTKDYLKFSYLKSTLMSRIKLAISSDIEDMTNESYFAYKQVYIPFTKGDSSEESQAYEKITEAKKMLDEGADIDDVISEYGVTNTTESYFDYYNTIVNSSDSSSVGDTIAEMVKSLNYGEYSIVLSGDESDGVGYYVILYRDFISASFICGDSSEGTAMYQYPYVGSSSYSSSYNEYLTYLDAFEANTKKEPVSERVYNRIGVNTLF